MNTTVFHNESTWAFEEIFQPLYTVSGNGKSTIPRLARACPLPSDHSGKHKGALA
jgi:hypothetical protein